MDDDGRARDGDAHRRRRTSSSSSSSFHASATVRPSAFPVGGDNGPNHNGSDTCTSHRRTAQNGPQNNQNHNRSGGDDNDNAIDNHHHSQRNQTSNGGSGRRTIQAPRGGGAGAAGRTSRSRRRGRSPPQPRAERSASRLLSCPSSADESFGSGGGGGWDSDGGSDDTYGRQVADLVEQTAAETDQFHRSGGSRAGAAASSDGEQRAAPRRRRRRPSPSQPLEHQQREGGRTTTVSSPTSTAPSADSTGRYFYSRTRSGSADTGHSAEQLLSIAQALGGGGGGSGRAGATFSTDQIKPWSTSGNHLSSSSEERGRSNNGGANMSAATRSQITDGGWSTGTGSSHDNNDNNDDDDGSESFVSWNESEHGSLPSHHKRAMDIAAGKAGKDEGAGNVGGGGRRSSATARLLDQLGVGAVPSTSFDAAPVPKPNPGRPADNYAKLSSAERARALMDEAQKGVQMRRSQQMGLFGGYERKAPTATSAVVGQQGGGSGGSAGHGHSREASSTSAPSAVARALMDSLQDVGGQSDGDDDDSTADGCYEDVAGDNEDADDRSSAEASAHRLLGRVGIARPTYPFGFGEEDSRDRSQGMTSDGSRPSNEDGGALPQLKTLGIDPPDGGDDGDVESSASSSTGPPVAVHGPREFDRTCDHTISSIHETATEVSFRQHETRAARDIKASKQDESGSSKSSWISGSISLEDNGDDEVKIDDGLREKLGLGGSVRVDSKATRDGEKEDKEYDPFDLGSATTADSGPARPPRWLQTQEQSQQGRQDDSSSSSSSSGSSSSESYTSGSSSESSLPAEFVVAEPGWDKGSVAESSIKSITAHLRSTVQEEAIREASAGAASDKKPEKLPVYRRMLGQRNKQSTKDLLQKQSIPSIQEDQEETKSPRDRQFNSGDQEKVGDKGVHDPFDLRSSDDGEDQEPKFSPAKDPSCPSAPSEQSNSSSSSGSGSSYTDGSSSADTPPARMVVTKEDWAVGSVAESSIKSITAHLRDKATSSSPEKLAVYGKTPAGANREKEKERQLVCQSKSQDTKEKPSARASILYTNKSASEPSLDPLYVAWGADAAADNGESSHEGEDNYQAWPDSPQQLRKCQPKPHPDDVDSIEKGWVIICINNIISPEKADEQERRAKRLSVIEHDDSSSGSSSVSDESSPTESSGSDVVRKDLTKREKANPNIVHEEQRAVGNLSAMWEAKANKRPDDPTKDAAVVQSRKQAKERIGAFRLRRNGAITVQSAWRSYYVREKWLEKVRSTIIIQRAVRTKLLQTKVESKSACLVQSAYRSHVARRNYRYAVLACVKMQALARGKMQRLESDRLKRHRAATDIQSWWRCRLSRQREDTAACRIQSVWRCHATTAQYCCQQSSAVLAQAIIRGGLQRKQYCQYRSLLRGAIALQSIARGARERLYLSTADNAAVCIQQHYRSYKVKEAMKFERVVAAESIQKAARRFIARRHYQHLRSSCMLIQSHARRMSDEKCYRRAVLGIITIQTWTRGIRCRRRLQEAKGLRDSENRSAVLIQTAWRGHSAQERCRQKRCACIVVQSAARGHICRQTYRRHRALVRGVTSLQAIARGDQARQTLHRRLVAATVLQSWWRRHAIAAEEENERSSTAIASCWRTYAAQKQFGKSRRASITLQSSARGAAQRQQYQGMVRSCVLMQAFARRVATEREYHKQLAAVLLIQRAMRSLKAKAVAQAMEEEAAAIVLQSSFRSISAARSYDRQRAATIAVQTAYRGSAQRFQYKNYRSTVRSVVTFQAVFRGVRQRKEISKKTESATVIASKWRSYHTRAKYLHIIEAAILLQAAGRGFGTRQINRRDADAARTIQCIWRRHYAKRINSELQRESAATKIQSVFRAALATKAFENTKLSAVRIQSQTRGWTERARFTRYLRLVRGCISLQAFARGIATRRALDVRDNSARSIQRSWRAHVVHQRRDEGTKNIAAAVVLQSSLRAMSASRCYRRQRSSAILLQSALRMSAEKKRYNNHLTLIRGVIILQSISRRKSARRRFKEKRDAAVLLQAWFRSFRERGRFLRYTGLVRACVAFQALVRGSQARGTLATKIGAANTIQQAWRRQKSMPPTPNGSRYGGVDGLGFDSTNDDSDSAFRAQGGERSTTEKLTRYNSIAISAGSSSSISRYLRMDSNLSKEAGGSDPLYHSGAESSGNSENHSSVDKCSSSEASYDEYRVTQALALGVAACGASCPPSLEPKPSLEEQPGLVASASDPSSTTSSVEEDGFLFHGDREEGQRGRCIETSSVGSSRLSDYFDDDLPPASRKMSSGQTAGVSSEALPKREDFTKKSLSSSSSSSSSNSDPVSYAPTVLAPVAEESFEYNSENDDVDLEANLDHGPACAFHATTDLDERRLDCVVPSSYDKMGTSVRARTEDLVRQNTLASANSLMGSSSNLSSCFQDDDFRSSKSRAEEPNLEVDNSSTKSSSQERKTRWNDSGKFNQQRQLPTRPPQQGPDGITSVKATPMCDSMHKEVSGLTMEASLAHTAASMRREASQTTRASASQAHSSMDRFASRRSMESGFTMETSLARSMLAHDADTSNASVGASTAGQSTVQHEDKALHPLRAADVDIEQGLCRPNDSIISGGDGTSQGSSSYRYKDEGEEENIPARGGLLHGQTTHFEDPSPNEMSNMEEGFGEAVSLIGNNDIGQGRSARHPNNAEQPRSPFRKPPKPISKPPRQSSRPPPRQPSSTLLPMHADDVHDPSSTSDNKLVTFYRGHRSWCYIFGLVGVLAMIAGIVVAFTVDFSGGSSTNTAGFGAARNDPSPPTAVPSFAPTPSRDNQGGNSLRPTPGPTVTPSRLRPRPTSTSPIDIPRYQDFVSVVNQVSSERDIVNPASPQYKAINWIAKDNVIDPESPFVVQRYILALLYFSTNGDSWSKCGISTLSCSDERERFLSESSECLWHGVTCNDEGFIISLELDRVGMNGAMPFELGSLAYLERLVLPRNQLTSTVPSSLGSLGNLLELDLFDNKISGTIPTELSQLPLKILHLSTNQLSGSLPPIFNPDLEILDVSVNDLDGTLPEELFDATLLKEVNLSMNRFSGTLSSDFDVLSGLRKLLIGLNSFSGDVPISFGDLKSLEIFHATYNDLTGSMPNEVCDLLDFRLKRLSTDCASTGSGRPAKIACSCCTLCLEGNNP